MQGYLREIKLTPQRMIQGLRKVEHEGPGSDRRLQALLIVGRYFKQSYITAKSLVTYIFELMSSETSQRRAWGLLDGNSSKDFVVGVKARSESREVVLCREGCWRSLRLPLGLMGLGGSSMRRIIFGENFDLPLSFFIFSSSTAPASTATIGLPVMKAIKRSRYDFVLFSGGWKMRPAAFFAAAASMICWNFLAKKCLRMKTITQETRTLQSLNGLFNRMCRDRAHWAAQTHLEEENRLLPMSQRAQVHGGQSSNSHCADRVVERVDVRYLDFAIACIKYCWEYQRSEGTDKSLECSPEARMSSTHKKRTWTLKKLRCLRTCSSGMPCPISALDCYERVIIYYQALWNNKRNEKREQIP